VVLAAAIELKEDEVSRTFPASEVESARVVVVPFPLPPLVFVFAAKVVF